MGIKLLLADDSITIQKVVGIIFANDEYELTLVDNGDAAITKAKEMLPDVFLVDALMPGKNGYEVCSEIRNDPVLKDLPLLLLTGAFEPFDEENAKKCGADDVITKPFESQQLIDKVQVLLQLGRERSMAVSPAVPVMPMVADLQMEAAAVADANSWQTEEPATFASTEVAWNDESVSQGMDLWDDLGATTDLPPVSDASFASVDSDYLEEPAAFSLDPASPVSMDIPEISPSTDFFTESEPSSLPAEKPALTPMALEAQPEDDLWGAFVLDDEVEEPVQFGDVISEPPDDLLGEIEEIEPLMLAEEEDEIEEIKAPLLEDAFGSVPAVRGLPFAEEHTASPAVDFAADEMFGVEPPAVAEIAPATAMPEVFSFDSPEFAAETEFQAPDQMFAPEEEIVPVAAPTISASSAMPVAADPGISEEQLVAALSRLSRDVIEKIVWEVVPDLAETLIREELRKIREQA